ncbi:MAG: sulfotransferase domain-containing protein [Promethearchaeota archaeon]|jgi:hypothetical protein
MAFKQLPYHRPNHYLFSLQKSGRTWVRMILAKVLEEIGLDPSQVEMIPSFHSSCGQVCRKNNPARLNAIFLYRDPRDCIVSRYFEISHRRIRPKAANPNKVYNNTLSDYIRRDDQYGIDSLVEYMNEWHCGRERFRSFMPVSYENLHVTPCEVVRRILEFIDVDCSDKVIRRATDYARFENMKKIEVTGKGNLIKKYHGTFGVRHIASDPESFRVRQGKIGGFINYLSVKDIAYVNERIQLLDEFFQYD